MSTLTFQPEADRYYAEGYWRDGDLWSDFARRAAENPEKPALILDDRTFTFDQLRRAAAGVSLRLAEGGVKAGDVVILLGRHSIEAAVAMLGCMHRGVVIAPLPPMFNETQLSALIAQTGATALLGFGGAKEQAKCERVADQVRLFFPIEPDLVDRLAQDDPPDEHVARHADDLAMVLHSSGTTSTPKGIAHSNNTLRYATQGICKRWELTGDDIYLVVCEFGFVGRSGVRLLPTSVQRRDRSPRQPLARRGRPAPDRGASLHLRPLDADAFGGPDQGQVGERPRVALDARSRGARADTRAPDRDERGVRRAAAGRLRPVRGTRTRRSRRCTSRTRRSS